MCIKMNIEQQHLNFQRAYVKTDYYKIYYEKTNAANSAFSWNNEAKRYTWHDVNSAWEMWLAAQQQKGYVLVPVEPTERMLDASRRRQWDDLSSPYEDMDMLEYNDYTDSALQALDVLKGE